MNQLKEYTEKYSEVKYSEKIPKKYKKYSQKLFQNYSKLPERALKMKLHKVFLKKRHIDPKISCCDLKDLCYIHWTAVFVLCFIHKP